MTDWRKLAEASDPSIPLEDLPKILPVLERLEAVLRPRIETIPHGTLPWTGPEE